MAKVPKVKKKEESTRSRAYRRQASPDAAPIKTPKDSVDDNDSWMYGAANAGVHKKAPRTKNISRQQRARQLKAIEHAERNSDKHVKNVADSTHRGRRVQSRRKDWEEINRIKAEKIAKLMADGEGADMEGAEDEDEIEEEQGADAPDAMADLEEQPKMPEQNLGQTTTVAQDLTPAILQEAEDIDDIS